MTITLYDLTGPQNHKRSFTYSESSSGLPTRPEWHEEAACKGMPTALFFSSADNDKRQAVEVCSGCLVKDRCAQSQAEHGDRDGTWGGVSYEDNRQRRKSPPRKPIEHGTARGYQLHWSRGERACDECREAASTARRDRYWLSQQERQIGLGDAS